jgi:hypothetical protein
MKRNVWVLVICLLAVVGLCSACGAATQAEVTLSIPLTVTTGSVANAPTTTATLPSTTTTAATTTTTTAPRTTTEAVTTTAAPSTTKNATTTTHAPRTTTTHAPRTTTTKKPSGGGGTVYITDTGTKFHRGSCRYLANSKIAISRSEAIAEGYTPCKVCKP